VTDFFHYDAIAKMIDHSLLDPSLTTCELEEGCALAVRYNVASVCILPYYLARCAELLTGTTVHPATTIGFPHGGQRTAIKVAEARQALRDGGQELDVVMNTGKARSGDWQYVNDELFALTQTIHSEGAKVKVIFEGACLDDASKVLLCEICGAIGADWIEVSSEKPSGQEILRDLELMRRHSAPRVQIKAAYDIRDFDSLLAVRSIGVSRVGATRTKPILKECQRRLRRDHRNQATAWKVAERGMLSMGCVIPTASPSFLRSQG
jgi:deoxyribose-phosphate aldolase